MPTASQAEYPRPTDWPEFEELCWDLYRREWRDPHAQRNGRDGQPQAGVDVFGHDAGNRGGFTGVQCKLRRQGERLVLVEVKEEIAKAETFRPPLDVYVVATTAPRDSHLQTEVNELNQVRVAAGKFPVYVHFWEDLTSRFAQYRDIRRQHFSQFFAPPEPLPAGDAAAGAVMDAANAPWFPGAPPSVRTPDLTGQAHQVFPSSSQSDRAARIEEHRRLFHELVGNTLAAPGYERRAALRAYIAPVGLIAKRRFNEDVRERLNGARRDSFHWLKPAQHTATEVRFTPGLYGADSATDQLIVESGGVCHYVQLLPTHELSEETRSVPWSTLHAVMLALVRFADDAYPLVFKYMGPLFLGISLERLDRVHVSFDLVEMEPASVAKPARSQGAQPAIRVLVEEEFETNRPVPEVAANLCKALLAELVYDGGDRYLDAWLAAGARSPG
jgi:hypothetical protein